MTVKIIVWTKEHTRNWIKPGFKLTTPGLADHRSYQQSSMYHLTIHQANNNIITPLKFRKILFSPVDRFHLEFLLKARPFVGECVKCELAMVATHSTASYTSKRQSGHCGDANTHAYYWEGSLHICDAKRDFLSFQLSKNYLNNWLTLCLKFWNIR